MHKFELINMPSRARCRVQRVLSYAVCSIMLLVGGYAVAAQPPDIVVSNRPLHSLVAGIMQGVGEPRLLIDEAVAPWDYTPDAADEAALRQANIVVWSGRELEPALSSLVTRLDERTPVFEALASEAMKVLPARDDEQRRDPFFWLDSRNMLILLDQLAHLVIEKDPERAVLYERNWQTMSKAIGEVDRILEFGYRDVSGVPVFFYHDTHQYFQQAYAMHVAGSFSSVGRSGLPDTAHLLEMHSYMSEASNTCLFTERGLEEPHLDVVVGDTGVQAIELDSLGVGLSPGADLYVDLMRSNHRAIAGCVSGSRAVLADKTPSDALAPDVRLFPERVTPRYLMQDQFGRTVTNRDFAGRFQLINFGYTYCPDVCPTSLSIMGRTMQMLGDEADQLQPIFITVDPQRDTPDVLKEYVAYFDSRMLGLSTSPEATKRTAELFKARYEKVAAPPGSDPSRYTMDHTASLYLLGRNGEFITKFAHGLPPTEVVAEIRRYMSE